MPETRAPLRLYTFSLSHFSEKIRWALAASDIPFDEEPWTPFFHLVPALRSGGKTTVPILETASGRIQDSTRILEWLDANRGPLTLVPFDPAERELAWSLEKQFDRVGEHVVRYVYADALADAESVMRYWTLDASPGQTRFIRKSFPALRWVFRRKLRTVPSAVARSRGVIEDGLAFLEKRLAETGPYLVGGRFSIADLTAAALLSPLACPDQHPVYSTRRYREGVASGVRPWLGHPALAWVREIYGKHRPPSDRAAAFRAALDAP